MFEGNRNQLEKQIESWLDEDLGSGDVTTLSTIPPDHYSKAVIHVKEDGVIAGLPVAELVFRTVDPSLVFRHVMKEGDQVVKGTIVAELEGSSRSILMGERLALNLLQRMSGIATTTHRYAERVKGYNVRVVDTRKTTPGLRALEKYAVKVGGGHNHRQGLYDAVMIKDNHIKASGGIALAIRSARSRIPHTMKIEVEVENMAQLEEALTAGADIIMLDNVEIERMREAVEKIKTASSHVIVEASGGVTLDNIREIAMTGVDVISAGALTHSIKSLDISLDLNGRKGDGA
ncbi:carboxylating nicotinate-nucleotide diphosphorylase [Ferviditalea candida]|uniref:nicotinate-nucleotide diphosphorylase (carboxylating) n=1 Tax=Ferviditalea candida TaxID=3108399 RepID=A0ABU5ZL87_9BACL|nr:carboxylating nicotinate-nucleotide diphosphorylase [Paenibacillaceae bacterium T2]